MKGTSVVYDAHGYKAPAQDRGSENKVLPITKTTMPVQSRRANLELSVVSIGLSWRKKKKSSKPGTLSGRLIQPIHCQLAFSARAAPTIGPQMAPPAIGIEKDPRYSGRSFRLVMSARMTSAKKSRPPPPNPCKTRPKISTPMLLAGEKAMDPVMKMMKEA